ncbi:MAG TPA: methyltransferase domain-containing protein [Stellaceae bacterium]|nr:methyltransferase domain-containing protein [Stellaceae bacterium]
MYTDVVDLRDFYETSLGQTACRMLRRRIRTIWPSLEGTSLVGIGYAGPYLRPYLGEAERVVSLMPAAQGVLHWPKEGPNVAALVDETDLPFQDSSIDRLLLVHALECAEQVRAMLDEVWRVLAGAGRVLVVVPNRRGIWAQLDRTPFGAGHPYTPGQLSRLLRDAAFTPVVSSAALYMPPTRSRMVLSSAGAWEGVGSRWFTTVAGVLLIEATKQIYAKARPAAEKRRQLAYRPAGAPV